MSRNILVLYCIIVTSLAQDDVTTKTFPDDFMFGTGSSSYQIEGAWNEDGKGENIWDHFTHTKPGRIPENANGDIACDSYHKYKEDVALLKDMGVNHYLFSLSWSRILVNGTTDTINQAGITYYKNLIKELKGNGIEPFVTLFYSDLPQTLQMQGGWIDSFIIETFANYARLCFEQFGDDVKYWLTFNDPKQLCLYGYGTGTMAPGIQEAAILDYKCSYIVIKAHATVWHVYDEEFRSKQNGKVSIAIETSWYEPNGNSTDNQEAAERKLQFTFGWFGNPVYNRDYPDIMKQLIGSRSQREHRRTSRLPVFTDEELEYVHGTYDFLGLNSFTSGLIEEPREEPEVAKPNYNDDCGVDEVENTWPSSGSSWLKITPWAMRKLLNWVKDTYDNPDVFIIANGVIDDGSSLNDEIRINYYRDYLSNVRNAMDDGVNVIGYTAWSFLDSFQWLGGYTERYGFYYVDFESENRTRTPKGSVEYFKKVISTRCLVDTCDET
ncbi:lactase-like protein [Anoplophora glabripennis]|uniref:Lactase-like protein n=1 Tax=Anoplophora glabripennis TaxID=217634 RepID=V5GMX6_ANOGL|nr:lactase-like protein [Anoplophora glabripennis]